MKTLEEHEVNEFLSRLEWILDFPKDLKIEPLAKHRGVKNVNDLIKKYGRCVTYYSLLKNKDPKEIDPRLAELLLIKPRLKVAYLSSKKFPLMRMKIGSLIDRIENLEVLYGIYKPDPYFEILEEDIDDSADDIALTRGEVRSEDNRDYLIKTYNQYVDFYKFLKELKINP